jgi:hypothetical protein
VTRNIKEKPFGSVIELVLPFFHQKSGKAFHLRLFAIGGLDNMDVFGSSAPKS